MSERRVRALAFLLILAIVCVLSGCRVAGRRESWAPVDPCRDRLHQISGHLLLYYAAHGQLPPTLDRLPRLGDQGELPPLVCPVSGKSYVYDRDGIAAPDGRGRVVLYDAEPVHSGMRWGITVAPVGEGGGMSAQVLMLPAQWPAPEPDPSP